VLLAIGMGGKPDWPENVYIVPLSQVTDNFVPKSVVAQYRSEAPYGNLEYCERGSECALFQGNQKTPPNWQRLFSGTESVFPKQNARPSVNLWFHDDNKAKSPRPGDAGSSTPTISVTRSAPPSRPSMHSRQHDEYTSNAPARRFSTLSWFWLLLLVVAAFAWTHTSQKRAEQANRQESFRAQQIVRAAMMQTLPKPEPQQATRSDSTQSGLPARAVPLLQYRAVTHPFRLSIERVERANERQIQRASDDARRAVSLFERGSLPPYFAVLTEPSEQSPRLSAYMIFDSHTGSFCANEVYITETEQPAHTVALVHRYECFFVNLQWLTDELRRTGP